MRELPPSAFQPVPMISNFWGMKSDLLPPHLSTSPRSLFKPRNEADGGGGDGGLVLQGESSWRRAFSVEDEVEMLCRLKILSGWRRDMAGNDLLDIVQGHSITWDQLTHSTQKEDQAQRPVADADAAPAVAAGNGQAETQTETLREPQSGSSVQESDAETGSSGGRLLQRAAALTGKHSTAESLVTEWMAALDLTERVQVWTAVVWLVRRLEGLDDPSPIEKAVEGRRKKRPSTSSSTPLLVNQRVVAEVRQLIERIAAQLQVEGEGVGSLSTVAAVKRRRKAKVDVVAAETGTSVHSSPAADGHHSQLEANGVEAPMTDVVASPKVKRKGRKTKASSEGVVVSEEGVVVAVEETSITKPVRDNEEGRESQAKAEAQVLI